MYIDGARQDRDDNRIHLAHELLQRLAHDPGRGIDNDFIGTRQDAPMPGQRHPTAWAFEGRHAIDFGLFLGTQTQPAHGRGLGVVIHQGRDRALAGVITGEVGRDGGLATAAFGIEYQYACHVVE